MKSWNKCVVLVCTLAMAGGIFGSLQASASSCQTVAPGCRRCVDDGTPTCCQNSGNCMCFYIMCPPTGASVPSQPADFGDFLRRQGAEPVTAAPSAVAAALALPSTPSR
ncbi:MAG TPA: hypothetical protein VOA87_02910 [Thermoanaerobaculia bacterium]|nr:hypothetical protein [Thermoanaerobaculia bacterium]